VVKIIYRRMYNMKTNYGNKFSGEKTYGIQGLRPSLIISDEVVTKEVSIDEEEILQPDPRSDVGKEEGFVTTEALNLREKPTKDSNVKHVLKKDDVLLIRGQKDGWVDVQHAQTGVEGFVMAEFIFIARID
jgi:uncharacterized protein YgiM (DUF1202 family)